MYKPSHKDYTTVLLEYSEKKGSLRPFYCCRCGKCVCEIIDNVRLLIPGMPEAIDIGLIRNAVHCIGYLKLPNGENIKCNAKYVF